MKSLRMRSLVNKYCKISLYGTIILDWKGNREKLLGLEKYWVPNTQEIVLKNVKYWDEDIMVKLLYNSIPYKQKGLSFNINSDRISIKNYLNTLKIVCSRITNLIWIWNASLDQDEFEVLLTASSKCTNVCFNNWLIETYSIWNFSEIRSSSIEELNFFGSGSFNWSNWGAWSYRFSNILEGISQCEFLWRSLKRIWIRDCQVDASKYNKLMSELGLSHILIMSN